MYPLKPLPKADWYFARSFLVLAGLCFAATTALVVVGDLFEKADDFAEWAEKTDQGVSAMVGLMAQYYVAFGPRMVLEHMLPLVVMMAAALAVSLTASNHEYVALRASGVSMQRAVLPILLPVLLIGWVVGLGRDAVLPGLIRSSHAIVSEIKPRDAMPLSLVVRDGERLRALSMGHYDSDAGKVYNFWMETREGGDALGGEAFVVHRAREALLQPRTDVMDQAAGDGRAWQWSPRAGGERVDFGPYRRTRARWREPLPTLVTPALLERQILGVGVMRWGELVRLASEDLEIRLEMERRRSEPWACFLVCLVGLPLVLERMLRGSEPNYVKNIILAVLVTGLYYLLRLAFLRMGETEPPLHPILAAWIPPVLYFLAGGWMYWRMERNAGAPTRRERAVWLLRFLRGKIGALRSSE